LSSKNLTLPAPTLKSARESLSAFVVRQAEEAAEHEGFGWHASELAPSTYEAVRREYRGSQLSGLPYRVSSLHCENIIFTSPEANHAMRFWHDMEHVRQRMTFDAEDEMVLGIHHLQVLRVAGFGPGTIEFRLLHADTIGQTLCGAMFGSFPHDQLRFAALAVTAGLDVALADEAIHRSGLVLLDLGGDAA
jgi:hypothetical protein